MEKSCRSCRKFGEKLFSKGERCSSVKCALNKRNYAPGSHGASARRKKSSEYGLQLTEKQKAKFEYGLRERQFRNYFEKAAKSQGNTGEALLQNLETRLDNVIYRLGWTVSRAQARQIVNHGHIKVNGKQVDIPSFQVKPKDVVEVANKPLIDSVAQDKATPPNWLKSNKKEYKAELVNIPSREEIETPIEEQLIVEFYSR